ncbi:MAG: CoB--CoM heterodisulfide reductase iron-sulfur subunit A family protein [Anaerolineales bacterium]|nr:CoB--CoM heterodisulfide reductase iron-sulfur subunit A family protein [Anaerolineales bacterium]
MSSKPRIGVYICHCGINIAATVDITAVTQHAANLPGVIVSRDYTYMCSDPGQALIKQDIAELELNRVVVASCSPRMHEPTFRATIAEAGLNPYCFEMANIREQCSWVHAGNAETTRKAIDLVTSAVVKAAQLEPLQERQVPVTPSALVIGGGVSGMQAALDIADAGFQVTLVEREPNLGGRAAQLFKTFPTLEPGADIAQSLIDAVSNHSGIKVLTNAQLVDVNGYIGNFKASVLVNENRLDVLVGTIVVASGYQIFDARRKPELGYGVYPEVITTWELEKLFQQEGIINDREPKRVVFIQCVGSRDQTVGNPYCSRICCMVTAKQARLIRQKFPNAQVTVFYMDVRAYGKGFEEFYDKAREDGVIYRRGNPSEIIRREDRLVVRAEDTLLGEPIELETDLVVLAVGMEPDHQSESVSGLLKLARSTDGFFLEAHPKLRPVETATAGVYLAGCCQGPKDLAESINQARAAAATAMIPLMRGEVPVDAATSFIEEELCSGCGQCAEVCTYSALSLHPVRKVMTVNAVLCQGCGACAATCPSGAINVRQFTFSQFMAQIEAFSDSWELLERAIDFEKV